MKITYKKILNSKNTKLITILTKNNQIIKKYFIIY